MKKHQKQKSILTMLLLDRSSGFSLAEVMVGAGILGALSLVVMNLTQNINRSQRSMENKFQLGQVFSQVGSALRNRGGCSATVGGLLRAGAPGTVVNGIFDGVGAGPIFQANQVLGGVTLVDGVGAGGGAIITVRDIRLIAYVDENGESTNTPEGQVTTIAEEPEGSGIMAPRTRDYGSALVRLTIDRGNTQVDAAANATVQNQVSSGLQTFQRDYRIKILVNPGTNRVTECYAVEESVVEAACEALDGLFSHTDGKCREIKVQEDPTNGDSNYAITSRGATLVREGGLRVGQYNLNEAIPGTGNLILQNNAAIGGNASVTGNLSVVGTGQINQNTGIGTTPGVGPTGARLTVQGNGVRIGNPGFTGVTDILNLLNSAATGHIHLSKQSDRTSFRVDSTNTANDFILMNGGGNLRFRVTHEGRVSIPMPAASSVSTSPVSALEIGVAGGNYFSAIIRNQPADPTVSSNFDIRGTRGDEVATKRWAASVIYSTLTTDVANQIANNITTYAANNQLDAIKRMICQSGRVTLTMGSGAENTSPTVIGSYASPTCTYTPAFCHGAAADQRCGILHVAGINSTGEILATGGAASIRVAGAGTVTIANVGTITATSTISSDTLVTAPTVRGTGGAASQGVCTANGCATRFGRQFCSGNAIMIGIAYGRIVCAGAGASYAP